MHVCRAVCRRGGRRDVRRRSVRPAVRHAQHRASAPRDERERRVRACGREACRDRPPHVRQVDRERVRELQRRRCRRGIHRPGDEQRAGPAVLLASAAAKPRLDAHRAVDDDLLRFRRPLVERAVRAVRAAERQHRARRDAESRVLHVKRAGLVRDRHAPGLDEQTRHVGLRRTLRERQARIGDVARRADVAAHVHDGRLLAPRRRHPAAEDERACRRRVEREAVVSVSCDARVAIHALGNGRSRVERRVGRSRIAAVDVEVRNRLSEAIRNPERADCGRAEHDLADGRRIAAHVVNRIYDVVHGAERHRVARLGCRRLDSARPVRRRAPVGRGRRTPDPFVAVCAVRSRDGLFHEDDVAAFALEDGAACRARERDPVRVVVDGVRAGVHEDGRRAGGERVEHGHVDVRGGVDAPVRGIHAVALACGDVERRAWAERQAFRDERNVVAAGCDARDRERGVVRHDHAAKRARPVPVVLASTLGGL